VSEEQKIEITSADAASLFAFGTDAPEMIEVKDNYEFFILSFKYGDIEYKINAFGNVCIEDGIYNVSVEVAESRGFYPSRKYANSLSAVTAVAFLTDRREKIVKISISYLQKGRIIRNESVYDFSLASKKLESMMPKLHRLVFVNKKISEDSVQTLVGLRFPFSRMREGQETFIRKAYSAIKRSSRLFVEAPTGIGKTISALYSSVRAMGEGYCDKIFYLTAKGSTASEAFKACEKLFSAGAKIRCVQISAKGKMCPQKRFFNGECDPRACPLMKGYYEKSEEAVYELLFSRYGYSSETVMSVAEKYGICPYELSLDLSETCGIVICDYNYVFDPKVRIKRYFDDNAPKKKYVFLIDEAHNLAARAKEMYSSSIRMLDIISLYADVSEGEKEEGEAVFSEIKKDINAFARSLKKISRLCDDSLMVDAKGVKRGFYISSSPMKGLTEACLLFKDKLSEFCDKFKGSCVYDSVYKYIAVLSGFTSLLEDENDGMRYYIEIEDKEIIFKCMCVDPSIPIERRLAFSSSAIFFSATFSPSDYYLQTLSPGVTPNYLTLDSPFPKENRFCAIYSGVSTRFEKRDNARVSKRMLALISSVLSAKKGNYMLYFPSYGYMRSIYDAFVARYPKIRTVVQSRDMTFAQRRDFINFFENDSSVLRVGFCVLGGSFSEGIDLPGNRLIGTVIFGVGLPGISNEQNIIKEYYDYRDCDGYDFAYTYPGFNNVLQAAGRVIRSEKDKGVIIFADDRYTEEKYKRMMPERYRGLKAYSDLEEFSDDIYEFWRNG